MVFPSGENLGDVSEGPRVKIRISPLRIVISLILDRAMLDFWETSLSTNIRRLPSGERDGLDAVVRLKISLGVIDLDIY